MVTSCKPQSSMHEAACNLSFPKTNRVLRLLSHHFYALWTKHKLRKSQIKLNLLDDHLLKDINQSRENIDPTGKCRVWNDPIYVEMRRRW